MARSARLRPGRGWYRCSTNRSRASIATTNATNATHAQPGTVTVVS